MDVEDGVRLWRQAMGDCDEVALVANPSYIASPYELYPLARRNPGPLDAVVGIVKDMDGTTTTTEPLCLHSLEWMVRVITDRMDERTWPGLDSEKDHPQVIGNSTTRHVEYLLRAYGDRIQPAAFRRAFVKAVLWTHGRSCDENRRREVRANAVALGLRDMLDGVDFRLLAQFHVDPFAPDARGVGELVAKYADAVTLSGFTGQVRAAVDIYYVRYHSILAAINEGKVQELAGPLPGGRAARMVAPMPGVGAFLALVKGWLGDQACALYDALATHVVEKTGANPRITPAMLCAIGRWFAANPARVAIVTSSIAYEANIVLTEVFRALSEEASTWPLPSEVRDRIVGGLADHRTFYDMFVTASDSSEIRLKPHRDLYSIALHGMGIPRDDYNRIVGFEDSESGVIAIRAAGVGCCVALPFAQSAGHDFQAAVHVLRGQFPEVVLNHCCFLSESALAPYA
jgi:beta-phosphoglucomutase-like phosphatase (HAD superfamily)